VLPDALHHPASARGWEAAPYAVDQQPPLAQCAVEEEY
jgi:hypothetical protein